MRNRFGRQVGMVGLAAGVLALSACGPSVGGGGAIATPSTSAATSAPSPVTDPPSSSTTSTPAPTPSTVTTSSPTSTPTSTPPPAYLMTTGAKTAQVRDLQSRLAQLNWYEGAISGTYDTTTQAGVRGFQSKRGMSETGSVDQATWASLTGMTRQPTDDEMNNRMTAGPALYKQGSTGAVVRNLQARLKQIGWWSGDVSDSYGPSTAAAVKSFQAKREILVTGEVDQRTLDKLNGMTRTPTSDELNNVKPAPAPVSATGLDPRCLTGHTICISKATRSLTWVVDGQPQLNLAVRFGSENTPTREGQFSVDIKHADWTSTLYGSKMPYSMFFSGGEAVHYSSDFAARGYAGASHGCVNVRDLQGITWLFSQVNLGDKVVVY
ncbi:peptidoglycan-binding protein [Lapillicoccus sp.]|uniref:L,D-transpeptidase family protein n=1 Tax=Lapillicoccus sp. TaxID=1909287 RepID=UPI003267E9D5